MHTVIRDWFHIGCLCCVLIPFCDYFLCIGLCSLRKGTKTLENIELYEIVHKIYENWTIYNSRNVRFLCLRSYPGPSWANRGGGVSHRGLSQEVERGEYHGGPGVGITKDAKVIPWQLWLLLKSYCIEQKINNARLLRHSFYILISGFTARWGGDVSLHITVKGKRNAKKYNCKKLCDSEEV